MTLLSEPVSVNPTALYEKFVNPQWARLLEVLQLNERYERCVGAELFTTEGRRILDFISGYCVHNVGHNHPRVIAALIDELDKKGPAMLQSHIPELAAQLAERLCTRAGGRLKKAYFGSSGSEGVETAIKFTRAFTRRPGVLYSEGGFHGLTCGALSLMSNPFWKEGFGKMLPDTEPVRFGDLKALEEKLATRRFAAFITEPIQAESGVVSPPEGFLRDAAALCRRFGTLLVLDEVQTGMYRTGPFLAAHQAGVEPDMVILAKALSGGLIPSGAVLMSDEICSSVYSSLQRAFVHTSTYSENSLAMRAGLITLDVIDDEELGDRAVKLGTLLREKLTARLSKYEMIAAVRGVGQLTAVEFRAPEQLKLRLAFEAFSRIHSGLFGQILVMRMFRDAGLLCQICGNNFMVLKVAPPLVVSESQIDEFVSGLARLVEVIHTSASYWTEALGLAGRVVTTL